MLIYFLPLQQNRGAKVLLDKTRTTQQLIPERFERTVA
ncbi:hypothetical protein RV02_GL001970 [Enterococcus gilvus]|nr:hypothetical protein RV02_GL001970 [Enterococcus gilvus]